MKLRESRNILLKEKQLEQQIVKETREHLLAIEKKYSNGLTAAEADDIRQDNTSLSHRLQDAKLEIDKLKEVANIAHFQLLSLNTLRSKYLNEQKELKVCLFGKIPEPLVQNPLCYLFLTLMVK